MATTIRLMPMILPVVGGFQHPPRCGSQPAVETNVLRFCSGHGSHKVPKIAFPYLLKIVPARSGCVQRRWFQDGHGITRLSSTSARVVPSVLISVGADIKPS